jgi:hypothetical protein
MGEEGGEIVNGDDEQGGGADRNHPCQIVVDEPKRKVLELIADTSCKPAYMTGNGGFKIFLRPLFISLIYEGLSMAINGVGSISCVHHHIYD